MVRRAALILLAVLSLPLLPARAETLGMVTGPKTGTYIAVGRDIAGAVREAGITVEVKPSDGSVDNLKRINSRENAALGIVQSDVLGFLRRSQNAEMRKIAANLRMILPLYREEVHVLARRDIQDFKQLDGKRVAVGGDGSGHMLTAVNLMALMAVAPAETLRVNPPEGVLALLDGRADAVFFVGGKPVKLFKNMEGLRQEDNEKYQRLLSEVHFLPLKDPRMLEEYQPAEIAAEDYDFVSGTIPTVAVTAVLVAYDFSESGRPDATRCALLYRLTQAVRQRLPELQAKGHPKWKEVSLDASLPIWEKDRCAWQKPAAAEPSKPAKKAAAKQARKKKPSQAKPASLPHDLRRVMRER